MSEQQQNHNSLNQAGMDPAPYAHASVTPLPPFSELSDPATVVPMLDPLRTFTRITVSWDWSHAANKALRAIKEAIHDKVTRAYFHPLKKTKLIRMPAWWAWVVSWCKKEQALLGLQRECGNVTGSVEPARRVTNCPGPTVLEERSLTLSEASLVVPTSLKRHPTESPATLVESRTCDSAGALAGRPLVEHSPRAPPAGPPTCHDAGCVVVIVCGGDGTQRGRHRTRVAFTTRVRRLPILPGPACQRWGQSEALIHSANKGRFLLILQRLARGQGQPET
ncbi:hypothetical protein NDU88_000937 [Pleurodeles waltl]|uniref:Uncharacterized protein n=1 Tax=Pleurodeles waltl TaxID=8319 RepID=A0AAV7S9H0_PLEWA|nr:hypothetical protein NDU88_000937 [Pleurodeles waltl]